MLTREIAINTAKSFVHDCVATGLTFYKVMIFGSVASENIHEWSDIDLLLVSDQVGDNIFDNLKLYSKINIEYPIIETLPYPTNYFIEGDSFLEEIVKGGIEIS
ncbi:MAG: nucleotidyltransferase domain-containing protein [Candidatus Kapabacteria bacterium]|nr:nucleotidyltransferase domain-containing protein [Candidatus Kapabacteria bacterium]